MKYDEYRPCVVNGFSTRYNKKGMFHKWMVKESIILTTNTVLSRFGIDSLRERFDETHVICGGESLVKQSVTVAIVEFENGQVEEVEPTRIKFMDSGNLFYENALFFRVKEDC